MICRFWCYNNKYLKHKQKQLDCVKGTVFNTLNKGVLADKTEFKNYLKITIEF